MKCIKCGYDIYEGTICPLCGYDNSSTAKGASTKGRVSSNKSKNAGRVSIKSTYSMKWYKFLKVILLLSIIANVFSAFRDFNGTDYQGYADALYEMFPSLKTLDMFSGIFCLAMAVFTFLVWHALQKYKASGPKMLTVMYILNIAFGAFYMFAFSSIFDGAETTKIFGDTYIQGMYQYQEYLDLTVLQSASVAPTILSTIGGIVIMIANRTYFKNRADMFVK